MKYTHTAGLYVLSINEVKENSFQVYARCCDEVISVGDELNLVKTYSCPDNKLLVERPAQLKIMSMKSCMTGKNLEQIQPVVTAIVELEGKPSFLVEEDNVTVIGFENKPDCEKDVEHILHCFKCEKEIFSACAQSEKTDGTLSDPMEGIWQMPANAVHFSGGSNFGSSLYDSFVDGIGVELLICDECLEKFAHLKRDVKLVKRVIK